MKPFSGVWRTDLIKQNSQRPNLLKAAAFAKRETCDRQVMRPAWYTCVSRERTGR